MTQCWFCDEEAPEPPVNPWVCMHLTTTTGIDIDARVCPLCAEEKLRREMGKTQRRVNDPPA